jgi:serine/threonine protein kinase
MKQMRALDLLARIAFAVAAIHGAGVVHRDLKPANVILRNGVSPVIVDFGVALVGQAHDAARGAGTPSYMAPEQVRGHRTDFRTDLYSIGVMAHELLIASRPEPPVTGGFALMTHHGRARRIRSRLVAAGVEMAVADLVACLLATRRQQRPNSAAFVGTRFAEAASRAAVDARE